MAAYHRVYDSRHMQADCQEPVVKYGLPLPFRVWIKLLFKTLVFCLVHYQVKRLATKNVSDYVTYIVAYFNSVSQ